MKFFIFIILSALFQSLAAVFGKLSASIGVVSVYQLYVNIYYISMLACLGVQALFWTVALKHFTLSFAYPILSISFVFNVVFAVFLFNETFSVKTLLGLVFIMIGVVMLLQNRNVDNA